MTNSLKGHAYLCGSSFCYVTTLVSFVTISIVMVEMFLICQVTSHDNMFKGLCEFMGEANHRESTSCHGRYGASGSGDIKYLTCHVTLQNHVIVLTWCIITLTSLVVFGIVVVEIYFWFVA